MINTVDKKKLVLELIRLNQEGDKWLDTVPKDIATAFYDNPYLTKTQSANDLLLCAVFGSEVDWVYWVLYEWREGLTFSVDDIEYEPKSLNECVDMLFTLGLISDGE